MIKPETITILIVDDMKSMRQAIRGMLKVLKFGRHIIMAENGRKAWAILEERDLNDKVDIAIIDWNMPVMNGIDLLNKIRNDMDLRDMMVIMITAENDLGTITEAAEFDIDAYLLKPFTPKFLEKKLLSVINIANNPPKATIHLNKARDFEEAGNIAEAINETKAALGERPTSSRILRNLGLLFLKTHDSATTVKYLIKATTLNKYDAISRYHLSDLFLEKNDFTNALKYYEEAIKINPRNFKNGMELGEILIKKGMVNKAVELFSTILQHSSTSLKNSAEIADICIANGELDIAVSILESTLENNPDNYEINFKLANLYEKLRRKDDALKCYKLIDKKEPNAIPAKLKIARINIAQKQVFAADEVINQILQIDPGHPEAHELRKLIK